MSEEPERTWVKADLVPISWGVECPSCGQMIEVEKVEDDDAGVFYGAEECCVVECEACDIVLDIQGARIIAVASPPYHARNYKS